MTSAIMFAAVATCTFFLHGCGDASTTLAPAQVCDYSKVDAFVCPGYQQQTRVALYHDIHDGDTKLVTFSGGTVTITGVETFWKTTANIDESDCSASIDFNVSGKENYPANNLSLTVFSSLTVEQDCVSGLRYIMSFTDPSSAPSVEPVNQWVEATALDLESTVEGTNISCPDSLDAVFADMADGDTKQVKITGSALTITPGVTGASSDSWLVGATLNQTTCSATVDFNVANKPNPPDFLLVATVRLKVVDGQTAQQADFAPTYFIQFTTEDQTVSPWPVLNQWVQLPVGRASQLPGPISVKQDLQNVQV